MKRPRRGNEDREEDRVEGGSRQEQVGAITEGPGVK